MSREQMCPFVRAVNMSHSTLKTPEGHGELYGGGRKWEGNKNVVGMKKKKRGKEVDDRHKKTNKALFDRGRKR